MAVFPSKRFRRTTTASSSLGERLGALYRANLPRHPFLLFGLPFITVIVAASFVLTPATALRYERHDRKVRQLTQEEAMELGLKGEDGEPTIYRNPRRRIVGSEREEYYVCSPPPLGDYVMNRMREMLMVGYSDSWPKISTIGNSGGFSAFPASPMADSDRIRRSSCPITTCTYFVASSLALAARGFVSLSFWSVALVLDSNQEAFWTLAVLVRAS